MTGAMKKGYSSQQIQSWTQWEVLNPNLQGITEGSCIYAGISSKYGAGPQSPGVFVEGHFEVDEQRPEPVDLGP